MTIPSPPRWARAADLVCLGLLILAAVVSLSGGFNIYVAGVRLGLTTLYRPLLWAVAIALARHIAAPTIPIYRDLPARFLVWRRRAAVDVTCVAPVGSARSIGYLVGTLALFTALTALMTYPQVLHMRDGIHDVGDPLLNLWALSWVAHQLPIAPMHLFDANIFAPDRWTLAYSETLLAPGLIVAPLLWMGVSSVLVYNIVLLSGFALSGVGTALLVRELTRSIGASIVAGVIFAFLPFRFDHYAHLQLQQAEWIPLALWAFHRVMKSGRLRDGLWLGVFVSCQFLSCMYYGIFLAGYLVVVGGAVMITTVAGVRARLPILAASVALALVLLAPAGNAYLGARQVVGERGAGEVEALSATWRNYLAAPAVNRLYGSSAETYGSTERRLFPGVLAVLLTAVALWPPWSAVRVAYALGLVFAVDMTLGLHGLTYPILYEHLTPFHALRTPARAAIMVGFSLAVLAGFGVTRLLNTIRSPLARVALAFALSAAIIVECRTSPVALVTIPDAAPPVYADLLRDVGSSPRATIVDVPIVAGEDQLYMYYSTFHWQTLVDGYSGFFPPTYLRLAGVMRAFPDARSLEALRAVGVRYAVIHGEQLAPEEYRRVIGAIDACRCELTLVSRRPWQNGEISLYRIP